MRYGTGVVLVAVAAVLWSGMGLAVRSIEEAGTWAVLFWRSAGMLPVLAGFVAWRSGGRIVAPMRAVGLTGVAGGVGLIMAFAGAIFALQNTTVANAMFLYSAAPFVAALLGWLVLGERVRAGTWAAIALAACGMVLMVGDGLSGGALAGNMAAICAALGFALFTIALRWGKLSDMMPAVAIGGLMSMALAAIMLALTGEPLMVPARDIAIAAGMGAVMLGGGMVLYTLGSRVVPAAEATLLTIIEVMLGPFWVWLVLGETASANTLIGGGFLVGAVALNALTGVRRAVPAI
ncbi:MAG: DMT family transporter [Paracoccaceae bacterium]